MFNIYSVVKLLKVSTYRRAEQSIPTPWPPDSPGGRYSTRVHGPLTRGALWSRISLLLCIDIFKNRYIYSHRPTCSNNSVVYQCSAMTTCKTCVCICFTQRRQMTQPIPTATEAAEVTINNSTSCLLS